MIVDGIGADSLLVLGATASGKTRLAVGLARALGGEVLSVDSRQVYRGLDVGTGKDRVEYRSGGAPVAVHLLDIADPAEECSLYDWALAASTAARSIEARGARPIFCGGTGLYLDALLGRYRLAEAPPDPDWRRRVEALDDAGLAALLREINPAHHNETDFEDRPRLLRALEVARAGMEHGARADRAPEIPVFGLRFEPAALRTRIGERLRARLEEGLLAEVEGLLAAGLSAERLHRLGLEYRWCARRLAGEIGDGELFAGLERAIWRFARGQASWFRRMERGGRRIHWLDGAGDPLREALAALESRPFAPCAAVPPVSDIERHD